MKYAVVTGASSGIGKCLLEDLRPYGYEVLGLDISQDKDGEVQYFDVTDTDSAKNLIGTIEAKKSRIDLWINCAGVSGLGEFQNQDKNGFDKVIEVNLLSVIRLTRVVLDHMSRQGSGLIVNISSVAGLVAAPKMSAYCTAKHGLVGFTRSLEQELRRERSNVRTLLVCPGFVKTPMVKLGETDGFPDWLQFLLSSPEQVSKEIVQSIVNGDSECFPTLNGKAMLLVNKFMPRLLKSGVTLLEKRSFTDRILNRHWRG